MLNKTSQAIIQAAKLQDELDRIDNPGPRPINAQLGGFYLILNMGRITTADKDFPTPVYRFKSKKDPTASAIYLGDPINHRTNPEICDWVDAPEEVKQLLSRQKAFKFEYWSSGGQRGANTVFATTLSAACDLMSRNIGRTEEAYYGEESFTFRFKCYVNPLGEELPVISQVDGAAFLRDCVAWLNNRPEEANANKSAVTLMGEYKKSI